MSFRFSLRQILGFFTIPALFIALLVSQFQLARTRSALNTLSKRFGLLQVTDRSKFNVVAANETVEGVYQWQVHLPPGRRYYLLAAHGSLKENDLPPNREQVSMLGGTEVSPSDSPYGMLISFSVSRSEDRWHVRLSGDGGSTHQEHPPATFDWLESSTTGVRTRVAGSSGTQEFSPTEPLILLFKRNDVVTRLKPGQSEAPTDGIAVWIQEFFGVGTDGKLIFDEPKD